MDKNGKRKLIVRSYDSLDFDEFAYVAEQIKALKEKQSQGLLDVRANKSFEEPHLSLLRDLPEDMLTFVCCKSDGKIRFAYHVAYTNFGTHRLTHIFKFEEVYFSVNVLPDFLAEFIDWVDGLNYGPPFGTDRYDGYSFKSDSLVGIESARKMLEKIWRMQ